MELESLNKQLRKEKKKLQTEIDLQKTELQTVHYCEKVILKQFKNVI